MRKTYEWSISWLVVSFADEIDFTHCVHGAQVLCIEDAKKKKKRNCVIDLQLIIIGAYYNARKRTVKFAYYNKIYSTTSHIGTSSSISRAPVKRKIIVQ